MSFKNKNTEKGFTLIEIMVVIFILALLAGIVAVNVIGSLDKAKRTKAQTDIGNLKTALVSYYADNGSFPTNDQGLKALVTKPETGKVRKWRQYIERLPKDPWGNDYYYQCPGLHGEYDIISFGNDEEEGGEGNNADINSWEDLD